MSNPLVRPRPDSPLDEEDSRPSKYFKHEESKIPSDAKFQEEKLPLDPIAESSNNVRGGGSKGLEELLDLKDVSLQDIPRVFAEIAESLIHKSRLKLECDDAVTTYQVMEIEFYLMDPERHSDPFTHGENEQGVSGMWYFHRAPGSRKPKKSDDLPVQAKPTGYRGGTRKGLDLTFGGPLFNASQPSMGSRGNTVRGGILLRSLRRDHDEKVISGPSLLVDEILRQSKSSSLVGLVNEKWNKDSRAFRKQSDTSKRKTALYFDSCKTMEGSLPTIYNSPRIGLDLSNSTNQKNRILFVDRHYRFFIYPHLLVNNGRAQTFVGLWRHTTGSSLSPPQVNLGQFGTLSGMSASMVKSYMGYYTDGRGTTAKGQQSLKPYLGANGKGVCSSNAKLLTMLGLLERLRSEQEVDK
ncbi:hypothetical protein FRC03_000400 [Tulasnella sp. 419]|nr:hypothetical protein FRC03_000400 [Tulasnella sp. 419]